LLRANRFCFCQVRGERLWLVNPLGGCELTADTDLMVAYARLGKAETGRTAPTNGAFYIRLLWCCGFLEDATRTESPDIQLWEFHDLLFHMATREHNDHTRRGATYRLSNIEPPEAIYEPHSAHTTIASSAPFERPLEMTVGAALKARRSASSFADRSLSATDLLFLLTSTARSSSLDRAAPGTTFRRPYPSAGGLHELEFYIAAKGAPDLAKGLYHFDSHRGSLTILNSDETKLDEFIERTCSHAASGPAPTLIIITTRLPRLAWKYEAVAYRLTLLNCGAALQTMYLAATAMGIGCRAIGTADSRLFSSLLAVAEATETAVAEVLVGYEIC
jgi:SagB-type dehydrogenase family enzyme